MDSKKAKHIIAKAREKKGGLVEMQEQLQKQLRSEAMRDILSTALLGAGVAGTVRGGQGLWSLLTRGRNELRNRPGVAPLPVPYHPSYPGENGEEKEAFVTTPMLIGGGIGAGYGAGSAPKGEVVQNMVHHGARGLGTGAGATVGGVLGAGAGIGLASLIAKLSGAKHDPSGGGSANIGSLVGLLAGGIGGGILGNKATKALLGKSPGERASKEDEEIEVLLQRAQQARQEGEDNNGFSFRKYSADKQAAELPKPGPTSKPGLWWYMPAMLGAGALGGLGGWKLIDHVLDKRRRQEIDDEVDESRNEFQEALLSQYKRGSASELGVSLDELYSKMNKEAFDLDSIISPDARGRILGGYATYAIPSSILGYLVVKGLADRGSRGKILEKAQRRRALKQQQSRPAELYAVPTPIDEEEE